MMIYRFEISDARKAGREFERVSDLITKANRVHKRAFTRQPRSWRTTPSGKSMTYEGEREYRVLRSLWERSTDAMQAFEKALADMGVKHSWDEHAVQLGYVRAGDVATLQAKWPIKNETRHAPRRNEKETEND